MNDLEAMDELFGEMTDDTKTDGTLTGIPATPPRFAVGSRARIIGNSNGHDYRIGSTVEIRVFDANDRTYQARESGRRRDGNWLLECDLAGATELDWAWLQTALPEEDVLLLRAFDGVEGLRLSPRVRDTLVSRIPGLKSAILRAFPTVIGGEDAR